MTKEYLNKIANTTAQGNAREESYYAHFSNFLSEFANNIGKTKTQITTLPKKTEAGNPDFRVWDGLQHIVGYVEAKKPGESLDVIEAKEQLKRYRDTFPNLILTDFYEFRLYRNGEPVGQVSIGRPFIAKKLKAVPPIENEAKFITLLEKFFAFSLPQVFTAENLANELAKRTRFLRDEVVSKELEEEEIRKGKLFGFYEAFKKYLIPTLTQKEFADIFSQTVTYGLFAARTRSTNGFNRKLAYDYIPHTIRILRDVFKFISLHDLPKQMEVMVDDIAEVLNVTDVSKILQEYYSKGKGEDPIVHFYETFLNIYDPATREKRGVYYTPEPVVRYIVCSVHELLKSHFCLHDGLASKEVTLLDPAGGTLTFPAEAIKLAAKEYTDKYGDVGLNKFISTHILKNFYAFELMMAPYSIGHIKISFLMEELGYKMKDDERFKLYLTNTLDMEDLAQTQIPGLESLSEENHQAGKVKKNEPVLVIIGNPPYSGHSSNKNDWTEKLLKENLDGAINYYEVNGKPLGEKNPKWLQDDYVKFLRFAQWKIHKTGQGIVAMITNHSYLDNPTFRGMRQSLLNTFNEIYILDLHGNSLKKEKAPDGSKDENVFDIMQGVSIAIFVKKKNTSGCKVFVNDLYGLREEKYKWLDKTAFLKKNYETEKPASPFYFLKKTNTKGIKEYLNWMSVQEIFPVNSVGIVTARDRLTIKWEESEILNTVRQFAKMDSELARQAYELGDDARDWQVRLAQDDLKRAGLMPENIKPILYRPFDTRFTYYTGVSRGFHCMPRPEVMQHMLKENLCLISIRRSRSQKQWNFALITDGLVSGSTAISSLDINYCFPLYLYPPEEKEKKGGIQSMMLFEPEAHYGNKDKKPNIAPKVFEQLEKMFKKKITPEEILHYVYAVLYSNIYKKKYAEFLKIDFPRIPFTSDYRIFSQLAELGEELKNFHLPSEFENVISKPIAKYKGSGDDKIEKVIYVQEQARIFINENKWFEGISGEIWNYHIGGYQIAKKYLNWRKGRQMDNDSYYCKMITSIAETIRLQKEIDKLFPSVEKNSISF